MELLTSKEFIEKLKTGTLKPALVLKGMVKKSDKDSEILFAHKPDFAHWFTIPATMIESVKVIKNSQEEEGTLTFVKLFLKKPVSADAILFADLFTTLSTHEKHLCGMHEHNPSSCGRNQCGSNAYLKCSEMGSHYGAGCMCASGGNQCGCGCHCGCGRQGFYKHGQMQHY